MLQHNCCLVCIEASLFEYLNVRFIFCYLLNTVQISATGASIGGLNFNNSSSVTAGNLSSRGVPMQLTPVADAGKSSFVLLIVIMSVGKSYLLAVEHCAEYLRTGDFVIFVIKVDTCHYMG